MKNDYVKLLDKQKQEIEQKDLELKQLRQENDKVNYNTIEFNRARLGSDFFLKIHLSLNIKLKSLKKKP